MKKENELFAYACKENWSSGWIGEFVVNPIFTSTMSVSLVGVLSVMCPLALAAGFSISSCIWYRRRQAILDRRRSTDIPLEVLQSAEDLDPDTGPEDHNWILIVSDVLVAVECLRRELLSTHDIVYFFLRRGTPFTIAHQGSTSTLEDDSDLIPTIPDGFQPDAAYFEQWETAVRDFLVSPRGHLVWRLGGLYWRIALYVLGTIPGHQDMIENDTGFITSKLRSGFYEEPLTPAELAIVIGLARVDDPNPIASLARMSYFPHPNAAEGTTLLSSVWTPLNEEWFVAHLLSIQHGGPGWRSQNARRKLLRGATTAHPLTRRLEVFHRECATEWLKAW
ncbi:hypothetical protein SCHPADRAFT_987665 [Schizopora paradoxa]|uniref:Uncharacterized protein n=1 Tax=Schizopora paradoxa TaxID=27342 RepID=A0A0H2R886_9AGAM|nr:hypothetical protein SCHPADRAFT_987665 [Schizopora paradoxa]